MKKILRELIENKKGYRIKESDKNIYTFTSALILFGISVLFLIITCYFKVIDIKNIDELYIFVKTPYFIGNVIFSVVISILIFKYLKYRFVDYFSMLRHRQELSQMILSHNYFEFKEIDLGFTRIEYKKFPKIYYKMKNGIITVHIALSLMPYQRNLEQCEKELETFFYSDLIEKEYTKEYLKLDYLYDTIGSRISIDEVLVSDGALKLMENVYWEYDTLPHMLICGGTGSGKSYYIMTLIQKLLEAGGKLKILDPKNSDLADLGSVLPDVYSDREYIVKAIEDFKNEMLERNAMMKNLDNYITGKNYAYYGLEPHFLVFDEYTAFMSMLGRKSMEVMDNLFQIVMLGRQMGYFIILACQRPDAQYLGGGIRDQFNFRVALGKNSELGYSMMFGEVMKKFVNKSIKGRGYIEAGKSTITEFYSPLIPKNYDFLKEIEKSYNKGKELFK